MKVEVILLKSCIIFASLNFNKNKNGSNSNEVSKHPSNLKQVLNNREDCDSKTTTKPDMRSFSHLLAKENQLINRYQDYYKINQKLKETQNSIFNNSESFIKQKNEKYCIDLITRIYNFSIKMVNQLDSIHDEDNQVDEITNVIELFFKSIKETETAKIYNKILEIVDCNQKYLCDSFKNLEAEFAKSNGKHLKFNTLSILKNENSPAKELIKCFMKMKNFSPGKKFSNIGKNFDESPKKTFTLRRSFKSCRDFRAMKSSDFELNDFIEEEPNHREIHSPHFYISPETPETIKEERITTSFKYEDDSFSPEIEINFDKELESYKKETILSLYTSFDQHGIIEIDEINDTDFQKDMKDLGSSDVFSGNYECIFTNDNMRWLFLRTLDKYDSISKEFPSNNLIQGIPRIKEKCPKYCEFFEYFSSLIWTKLNYVREFQKSEMFHRNQFFTVFLVSPASNRTDKVKSSYSDSYFINRLIFYCRAFNNYKKSSQNILDALYDLLKNFDKEISNIQAKIKNHKSMPETSKIQFLLNIISEFHEISDKFELKAIEFGKVSKPFNIEDNSDFDSIANKLKQKAADVFEYKHFRYLKTFMYKVIHELRNKDTSHLKEWKICYNKLYPEFSELNLELIKFRLPVLSEEVLEFLRSLNYSETSY